MNKTIQHLKNGDFKTVNAENKKEIMKRKFTKGDMVGWKSNTEFTKENKNKPAQRVIDYKKCIDGEGWEYRITNCMGWQMQHELENRI
jgi:hypothetical protein